MVLILENRKSVFRIVRKICRIRSEKISTTTSEIQKRTRDTISNNADRRKIRFVRMRMRAKPQARQHESNVGTKHEI